MPKLPKELLEKKKEKMQKVKPSTKSASSASRAMRRQLQKQGIDNVNEIEATRVIIQCPDKEIVIENPQVMQLTQQGMTIHQILGEPVEQELSSYGDNEYDDEESEAYEELEEELEVVSSGEIRSEDIAIVAAQAGVSEKEAEHALKESDGDLARAILFLKSK
ncbi:MAG: Nascent polypeptide-associated complex protein [Candidatus Lokiarchaeota archaeon]|nr:Nascent polypeptide-associated complex protein [Candidatus Lokiarchaeota archaeon]